MAQVAPRTVNPDLFPIAVLIDELRHDDPQTRLNAVQQLEHIASALGPARTRSELIPFVMEANDDNDTVLAATADKLGMLVDSVGGPEHSLVLIRPLEDLLMLEEATVRDKALASLIKVFNRMPTKHVADAGVQLVTRLASNDWFVARICACTLIPEVSHRTFSEELLRAFLELCDDETPMVRRAAILSLPEVAKETPSGKQRDLLDALRRLARDDQDSVRIQTIPVAMNLAQNVFKTPQDCYNALFPEIRSCADDPSWRVRVTLATAIKEIIAFTPQKHQQQVFDMFMKLLADSEAEVRSTAIKRLSDVCSFRPADRSLLTQFIPSLNKLVRDDSDQVRTALAEALPRTCPVIGPALSADSLLQFLLKLLRDSNTSVRLKVLGHMDLIAPQIKLEELSPCVLPAVMELSSDREWRVRIGVLEQSTHLAKSLGHELFIEELMSVVLKWLCDPVFKVREAAAAVLSDLAVELGPEATVEHILPQLSDLARNSNYLYRMTTLMGCVSLSQSLSPALVGDKILPVVKQLVNDSVPNVRFNVAKALKAIAVRLPRRAEAVGAPLRTLMADADKDVRFFAKEAIVNLDSS
jgi:serine/threonine-protein phosphatase 2A regulatory subunit A